MRRLIEDLKNLVNKFDKKLSNHLEDKENAKFPKEYGEAWGRYNELAQAKNRIAEIIQKYDKI